jgi:hypothetical protein
MRNVIETHFMGQKYMVGWNDNIVLGNENEREHERKN